MKSTGKELVKQQENLDLEILNGDVEKADKEGRRILSVPFSYDKFIIYGKNIQKRTLQDDLNLARLLYRANQELGDTPGYRSDLAKKAVSGPDMQTLSHVRQGSGAKTFKDFCKDLDISRATAYRAIAAYNAAEDRLYTKEEMKEMVAEAWDSLCRDIHHRRTHGDPLWKPEKWNDTLEFRYEQWLEAHGYKPRMKVDPSILNDAGFFQTGYPSFGPFTFEFLDTVGHYCLAETSGENAIRYFNMCERWKSRLPSGVKPQEVFRIPVLVKGAIAQLPPESRKAATILVANILRDYVEGEV